MALIPKERVSGLKALGLATVEVQVNLDHVVTRVAEAAIVSCQVHVEDPNASKETLATVLLVGYRFQEE